MNPPPVIDAHGTPYPERRQIGGRREADALPPEVLLGYEQWAGRMWKHRAKVGFVCSLLVGACSYTAGYLGRAGDLAHLDERLTRVEEAQRIWQQNESAKMNMLCSLTRRIDPLGLPLECDSPRPPRKP